MTFQADDAGFVTVVVTVAGEERGRFRLNAIDGQALRAGSSVALSDGRIRSVVRALAVLVDEAESYEYRCASHPSL